MSSFQFICGNSPIGEVENPYITHLSVRQALAQEMELPDFLTENPEIDFDEKVIMVCESEEHAGEIEIKQDLHGLEELLFGYTNKRFAASLNWIYSPERAVYLADHLKGLLGKVDELEIWNIGFDRSAPALIQITTLSKFSVEELAFLDHSQNLKQAKCLRLKKD